MPSWLEYLLSKGAPDPDGAMAQADVPSGDLLAHITGGLARKGADAVQSAVTAPRDAYRGDLQVFDPATGHVSDEAMRRANEMAGLAMTGSAPFKAPAGAVRSFGGAAAKDDPIAALEAMLADIKPEAPAPGPRMLDPTAKSWDLYHGSEPGPDFARFDPTKSSNPAESGAVFFAPDAETAANYAGSPKAGAEAGSRVYRTTVDPGRTGVIDLAHLAETDPAFNARAREITAGHNPANAPLFDDYMAGFRSGRTQDQDIARQLAEMGYAPNPSDGTRVSHGHGHIGAAIERAKAQGLDTAILRGLAEHGGDDQVIALTPNRVRSYYAPDQLLYSGGPGGLAAAVSNLGMGSMPDKRR